MIFCHFYINQFIVQLVNTGEYVLRKSFKYDSGKTLYIANKHLKVFKFKDL